VFDDIFQGKQMTYRATFLLLITFLVSGCATHQAGTAGYKLITPDQFDNSIQKLDDLEKFSTLIIKRDSGVKGSVLPAKVHLDGLFLTNIKEGQYVELKVSPGVHTLLLKTNGFALVPYKHELKIEVTTGSINYYRIYPGWPDGMQLSESPD
jgi:hypothetical protein